MIEGILLKGYGGFYYVLAQDRVWECSLRGRFRVRDQDFLPGDRVEIEPKEAKAENGQAALATGSAKAGSGKTGPLKATVEKVLPRKNALIRPSIANVDQALLVFALALPKPDLNLLDRLIIQVLAAGIRPWLVLTKKDRWLGDETEAKVWQAYSELGYLLAMVSNKTGEGIEAVRSALAGKITVLAGPSGVGKSSLLNALAPGVELRTGDVSEKSKRGRHTTRHTELFPCAGGLLADTPGFSALDLPKMKREELAFFFPEMAALHGLCRFKSCLHDKEPDCAVKSAVERGEIHASRYKHYQAFLQEVMAAERRY